MLEKLARASLLPVAPTVSADVAPAGLLVQASEPFSLPAATAQTTPCATLLLTAVLRAELLGPPIDMLPTNRAVGNEACCAVT